MANYCLLAIIDIRGANDVKKENMIFILDHNDKAR